MGICSSAPNASFVHEEKQVVVSTLDTVGKDVKIVTKDSFQLVKAVLGGAADVAGETLHNVILSITQNLPVRFNHVSETSIPGVYAIDGIHNDLENLFHSSLVNEAGILISTAGLSKDFNDMVGEDMSAENFKKLWFHVSDTLGIEQPDCNFLPEKLDFEQIKYIVQHNAFVTMGMSYEDDGLCFNATKNSSNPITASAMSALPDDYATAKLWLSTDLTQMRLQVDGQEFSPEDEEFDVKLRIFMTCLLYFFELCHATLHVYAYIMLEAASVATTKTELDAFMEQYREKVFLKYQEVALLLLKEKTGLLVGGYWTCDGEKAAQASQDIFAHIASQTNAVDFFRNVMCGGVPQIYHNRKILPQARQYVPMMQDLAVNVNGKIPTTTLETINKDLGKYFMHTAGKGRSGWFEMETFQEWLECQGMMGILHGNTLGISRLILSTYCRATGDWTAEKFDETWPKSLAVVGTLMGLEEEHAIMQEKPVHGTIFQSLYNEYEAENSQLQEQFWSSLDEEDRVMYGWITSVWGPNMLDQTQLTITTYV